MKYISEIIPDSAKEDLEILNGILKSQGWDKTICLEIQSYRQIQDYYPNSRFVEFKVSCLPLFEAALNFYECKLIFSFGDTTFCVDPDGEISDFSFSSTVLIDLIKSVEETFVSDNKTKKVPKYN